MSEIFQETLRAGQAVPRPDGPQDAPAVLHLARLPMTGVWSLMRNLALWQREAEGRRVGLLLLLNDDWPQQYHEELAALRARKVDVTVVPATRAFGTLAFFLHFAEGYHPRCHWRAAAERFHAATGTRDSVVHVHNAWLSGVFLSPPPPGRCRASVVTFHGVAGARALRRQPVRRWIHRQYGLLTGARADALVSVDSANPTVTRDLFGLTPDRFEIIANGVYPLQERGCPGLTGAAGFTVGHVGVIDEGKGWEVTARAVDLARARGVDARLLIAGAGPEQDRARDWCGSRPHCEYLGTVRAAARTVMPRLDLMALPSLSEGLPMALLEALSAGVPIVATRVGGIPEIVQDDRNGYLVQRSEEAVAAVIERLARDRASHERVARGALERFQSRFHIGRCAEHYARVYARAIEEKRRRDQAVPGHAGGW